MAKHTKRKGQRTLMWLAFSVVFALCPLFINYLLIRGKEDFHWLHLLNRGELFLISATICADAVGRMWEQKARAEYFSSVCLITCVFVLVMCSSEFGMAAQSLDVGARLSDSQSIDSVVYFGVTIMAGLGAVLVEE